MNITVTTLLVIVSQLSTAPPGGGKTTESNESAEPIRLPPVVVSHTPEDLSKVGGSAHLVDQKTLETFEYDDAAQILYAVPGVYVRQEDAYGLRPNIGLRGANSERSKKVTLMEDGVLFGPAPYSAPAAYYFPLMTRITGMEVFKGPSAIMYGPQTIGGAINVLTRDIPRGHKAYADIAYGGDNYLKTHGHYGWGGQRGGILLEGVHLMTDGFKELDGSGDTGFHKQELMLKGRLASDPLGYTYHRGDLKLGFSNENSNETYLGLSDADFKDNPYRRYRASALDLMKLRRFQVESGYTLQVGDDFDMNIKLYWHHLTRSWNKLNRFANGPSLSDILADPTGGKRQVFYNVLTGSEDSASDGETLMIGDNAREFTVLGAQLNSRFAFDTGPIRHELRSGLRFHFDQIDRDHTENGYRMDNGNLISDGKDTIDAAQNRGLAYAFSGYVHHALHGWGLTAKPGLRIEYVQTELLDKKTDKTIENDHMTLMPGIGLHYEIIPHFGVLAGVYRGFSPVAPGQADDVEPEISINYEFGLRYSRPESQTTLEAIGFFNDYSNLVGQCTFSAGCEQTDLDKQFNGGEVNIFGLEAVVGHNFELGLGLNLPIRGTYTYTSTEFQNAFDSKNPQFGSVAKGDALPYVPAHQASLQIGIGGEKWDLNINTTYVSEMYEEAGQDDDDTPKTDDAIILDASVQYRPLEWLGVYVKGDNLLMQQVIMSRRPFGARPGKPLMISGGMKLNW